MKIVRIYTGDDDESHFEDVEIPLKADGFGGVISEAVKVEAVMFRETGGDYNLDYHTAPRRQYVVNLRGSVIIETGLGDKRVLGPGDILLAEDTTGRGHLSRAVEGEPRECLFIPLA